MPQTGYRLAPFPRRSARWRRWTRRRRSSARSGRRSSRSGSRWRSSSMASEVHSVLGGGADTYGAPDVLSPEVARVPTTGRTSIATDLSDVFLVTFYSWWLFSFVQTVRGKRQPRVPRPLRRSAPSPSRRRLGAVPGGVPALGAGPHRGGPRLRPPRRGAGPTPEAVPTPDTWVRSNDDRTFTQKFAHLHFFLLQICRIGLLYRRSLLSF